MKTITLLPFLFVFLSIHLAVGQDNPNDFDYEPSTKYPYGRPNPDAPEQVTDFKEMIGTCDCISHMRNPDQTWGDSTHMTWKFSYIMNGTGVQDEVWRNGFYAGSIRQFQADSGQWVVTYYSYPGVAWRPGVWHGSRTEENTIVLYNAQKAPNGMDGFYKITFYDLRDEGFNWLGEWVNPDESITYPTWKIYCTKRKP